MRNKVCIKYVMGRRVEIIILITYWCCLYVDVVILILLISRDVILMLSRWKHYNGDIQILVMSWNDILVSVC